MPAPAPVDWLDKEIAAVRDGRSPGTIEYTSALVQDVLVRQQKCTLDEMDTRGPSVEPGWDASQDAKQRAYLRLLNLGADPASAISTTKAVWDRTRREVDAGIRIEAGIRPPFMVHVGLLRAKPSADGPLMLESRELVFDRLRAKPPPEYPGSFAAALSRGREEYPPFDPWSYPGSPYATLTTRLTTSGPTPALSKFTLSILLADEGRLEPIKLEPGDTLASVLARARKLKLVKPDNCEVYLDGRKATDADRKLVLTPHNKIAVLFDTEPNGGGEGQC